MAPVHPDASRRRRSSVRRSVTGGTAVTAQVKPWPDRAASAPTDRSIEAASQPEGFAASTDVDLAHEEEVGEHGDCDDNPHDQENYEADIVVAHPYEIPFVRHA